MARPDWFSLSQRQYAFFSGPVIKFWQENFWVDLNENKRGLGNVCWNRSNDDTSWNI